MRPIYINAIHLYGTDQTREGPMITPKSHLAQTTLAAMTFVFVLGALAMIWPGIIALMFGIFLLLQSFMSEPEVAVLSWATIDDVAIAFASLRRPGNSAILA